MKINHTCILGALCLSVLMGGCTKEAENPETMIETKALSSGEYGTTLPFQSSNSRQQHQLRSASLIDNLYIGTGLLNYTKAHFSVNNYTIQEGQFLIYDELSNLLGRESENNSDALNPASGTSFDTGNGKVKDPVLVRDIYEVDFIRDKETRGVGLALVLNSYVGEDDVKVSDAKLQAFGEEAARKLVSYMRKMPEIGDSMPIYIALYKNTSMESILPGSFFSEAFFEGRSASFSSIQEKWVMFPGEEASKLDNSTVAQFTQIKNAFSGFLPDDVSMIGRGKFVDDKLSELHITVEMYAKTATEALSLTQYLKTLLSTFSSLDYKLVVEVRCQDVTIATMVRAVGDKDVEVNTLL